MSMAIIGGVVGILGTGYGIYSGVKQKSKAKKELARLNEEQPIESLPKEILESQELASLRSKTGLPTEQYNMAMKNIQRQQAKTLKAANDRRMGLNVLSTIDDNAQRAIGNLDVQNAIARQKNEKVLMDVNNQVGNYKRGVYDRNVRQVWNRNFDYNMGLLGQGNQNISDSIGSGLNLVGSLASSLGKGGNTNSNSSWVNGLFGRSKSRKPYIGSPDSEAYAGAGY